ncbi:MAG TPA: hypothetical protein VGK45_15835 [Thermoanaerobaculia bacterium]
MTTMTAIEFEKGQAVEVFTEDEWCKGIVTGIDEKSGRPCRVMYRSTASATKPGSGSPRSRHADRREGS